MTGDAEPRAPQAAVLFGAGALAVALAWRGAAQDRAVHQLVPLVPAALPAGAAAGLVSAVTLPSLS